MLTFNAPLDLVRERLPEVPVACVRPERVSVAASWFRDNFPGRVLYAVKANPSPWALDAMYNAGMRWFDVASEAEIELVHGRYPDATMAFMHPVKSRKAIERAYFAHGVRIFSLDCEAELEKIAAEARGSRSPLQHGCPPGRWCGSPADRRRHIRQAWFGRTRRQRAAERRSAGERCSARQQP